MQPIVSVLMTAYNREDYIAESILSVINSSFQHWELIITDDCSSDRTFDIANKFAEQDSRIRLFKTDKNLGDYPNRNFAACLAKGKYLKYLDADDTIYKYTLQYMIECMESNPTCGLGISLNTIDPHRPYPFVVNSRAAVRSEFLDISYTGCGPSAAIIRKSVFEKHNGFSGKQFIGDTELWFKIISMDDIILFPPSIIWWRVHPNQQSSLEIQNQKLRSVRLQLRLDFLFSQKQLFNENEFEKALKCTFQDYTKYYFSRAVRKKEIKPLIKAITSNQVALKYWILAFKRRIQ